MGIQSTSVHFSHGETEAIRRFWDVLHGIGDMMKQREISARGGL